MLSLHLRNVLFLILLFLEMVRMCPNDGGPRLFVNRFALWYGAGALGFYEFKD